MGLAAEFKEFVVRGNVVDLAVGVIIGAAFGKIVSALVDNVIMPLLGLVIGGVNFTNLAVTLATRADGKDVILKYGAFLQALLDFAIIAFVIFIALKGINRLKKPAPVAAPPAPSAQEVLLTQIRDLLARR
jgi:large conductance mechanosensitive channel